MVCFTVGVDSNASILKFMIINPPSHMHEVNESLWFVIGLLVASSLSK